LVMNAKPTPTNADWPVPHARSRALFERARKVIPGGVMGEGRTGKPYPLYMTKAAGARMWDVDGNEYVDFHNAFGAVLLGHNDPRLRRIIDKTLDDHGLAFSAAHPFESELAERLVRCIPSAERVVLSCTGSEATFHAIRLARAQTRRPLILKFEGNYHGWHDYTGWSVHFDPAAAGPADAPRPVAESEGMPPGAETAVITCGYNDVRTLRAQFDRFGSKVAAVIVEPIFFNAGVIPPQAGFLEECRNLCTRHGSVLIFDEVISGFRVALGGAQKLLGVTPDITTLGKAIANGVPISAIVGKAALLDGYAPLGKTLFSGTFYGHVLNVALANACTEILESEPPYDKLNALGELLRSGIQAAIDETGVHAQVHHNGSVWALYFTRRPIHSYRDIASFAQVKNHPVQSAYQRWMLTKGIYIHPTFMIRGYINAAHSADDIERTVDATRTFFVAHRQTLLGEG
jgi:glutamate-1-semialdehyde 2,1-aminomutase